ncbi:PTS IIA-like nitrogen regulatory protein PtsN [Neptunomonas japonica]|uniref:PTS system, nitrogen regulatory IIA component n=1 Tax=Neptunomonas japonica JAMM 1380 TaxID=1441457 RepID=A0A7R6SWJ4_9GAMM|nr:PTS IIA-like nitrogen regulatory protein PtsN [Neptunomonas japonica]BBB30719.1 PTS system, nitrogen regulatory IIA component [Neptunomonas japonica JAMM 1380]
MPILSLLSPERVLQNIEGGSKKRIIELVSKIIAESNSDLSAEAVFSGLIGRERLGSTGIGEGVAIPHCRLANVQTATGALIYLSKPIDFDAIDNRPVDLLFFLLVPEEACDDHLSTLGKLAEVFSQEEFRDTLRNTHSNEQLLDVATQLFRI